MSNLNCLISVAFPTTLDYPDDGGGTVVTMTIPRPRRRIDVPRQITSF